MAVYKFEGDIGDDHRLELPANIPAGRAEIVVLPKVSTDEDWDSLKQLINELAEGPGHTRSREDIVASVRLERDTWE